MNQTSEKAATDHGSDAVLAKKPLNTLTIASGKGGVGKTWFSVTLSHMLAFAGKRVLLFDGDLGLANIDIQLGLTPAKDLGSVIAGRASLKEIVSTFEGTQTSGAVNRGSFDVIAGKSGSGTLAALRPAELQKLAGELHSLSSSYDHMLIDLGAGIGQDVMALTQPKGVIIAVITDQPTSLTDAYALIKLMKMKFKEPDIRIVVNQAASRGEGERIYNALRKACESFLKISPPLLGVIRRDPKVNTCIRHQTPILTKFPQSKAGADVKAIVNQLFR